MRTPSSTPLLQPLEDAAVGGFEHVRALHAQADQRIHVEETPVPKLLVGGAPIGQPIVLLIQ